MRVAAVVGLVASMTLAGCIVGNDESPTHLLDNGHDHWSMWSGDPMYPAVLSLLSENPSVGPGERAFEYSIYWPHHDASITADDWLSVEFKPRYACYDSKCGHSGDGGNYTAIDKDRFLSRATLAPGSWVMDVHFSGEHGNGAIHVQLEVKCPDGQECPPLRESCRYTWASDCVGRAWEAYQTANASSDT